MRGGSRVVDLGLKLTVVAPIAGIKFIPFPNKFRSITIVNNPLVEFENVSLTALLKETSKVDLDEWWPTACTPRFIVCVALPPLFHAIRIHAG